MLLQLFAQAIIGTIVAAATNTAAASVGHRLRRQRHVCDEKRFGKIDTKGMDAITRVPGTFGARTKVDQSRRIPQIDQLESN